MNLANLIPEKYCPFCMKNKIDVFQCSLCTQITCYKCLKKSTVYGNFCPECFNLLSPKQKDILEQHNKKVHFIRIRPVIMAILTSIFGIIGFTLVDNLIKDGISSKIIIIFGLFALFFIISFLLLRKWNSWIPEKRTLLPDI